MPEAVRVSAPASAGNLGPGFDAVALALELRCRVTASPAGEWSVSHVGRHRPRAGDRDIVEWAARHTVAGPLALVVDNDIPLGRGLGSSAAACAAGAAAALVCTTGRFDDGKVLDVVAGCEGHADNAAAAVHGGLIGVDALGRPIPLVISEVWQVVVAIPSQSLSTAEARAALDPDVPRAAVVRSLGRFAALLEGLRTGDGDVLGRACDDELHEAPRADLNPGAQRLIGAARGAGAAHAAWSGAGPSVISFVAAGDLPRVERALRHELGEGGIVRRLEVASRGLTVETTE